MRWFEGNFTEYEGGAQELARPPTSRTASSTSRWARSGSSAPRSAGVEAGGAKGRVDSTVGSTTSAAAVADSAPRVRLRPYRGGDTFGLDDHGPVVLVAGGARQPEAGRLAFGGRPETTRPGTCPVTRMRTRTVPAAPLIAPR